MAGQMDGANILAKSLKDQVWFYFVLVNCNSHDMNYKLSISNGKYKI